MYIYTQSIPSECLFYQNISGPWDAEDPGNPGSWTFQKSTDSTGSMDSMYRWATESDFEVAAKGGADPTSFSMSWCRFEHWPHCFPTSHLDIFFIGLLSFLSFSIWTNLFFSGGATSCCNFGDKTEGVSTRRLVFPYIVKVVALICSQTPQAPRCLGPQMHQTGQANGKNRNTSLACAAWSLGAETGKIWKGSLNLESGVITRLLMILMIKYQLSSISDHQYPLVNKFQWP